MIRALENRVAIYSPHTAYDAAPQGVNSWLAKGLGTCTTRPIHPSKAPNYPTEGTHRLEFSANHSQDLDKVMSAVRGVGGVSVTSFAARYMICSSGSQTCFLLFIWYVCFYGQVHTIVHVWKSEDSLGKWSSPSAAWVPKADLMQAWQEVPLLADLSPCLFSAPQFACFNCSLTRGLTMLAGCKRLPLPPGAGEQTTPGSISF